MNRRRQTLDRASGSFSPKGVFARARRAEKQYAKRLREVARQVGVIINGFDVGSPDFVAKMTDALNRYAMTVTPWAEAVGARMVAEVSARDRNAWMLVSREMSASLRQELLRTTAGQIVQERIGTQVELIRSLPLDAAERAQKLAAEAFLGGRRASDIAEEIAASGTVSMARANVIARTEVSRTATAFTQARCEAIGSDGYVWRTAEDSDVRASHRKMNGKLVKWDNPPTLDGMTGHAGQFPNCRCYPEPVLP